MLTVEEKAFLAEMAAKHLPGRHDQSSHGRRRGSPIPDAVTGIPDAPAAPTTVAEPKPPKPRRAPKPKPPAEVAPRPVMPTAKPRAVPVAGANFDAAARTVGEYVKFDKVTLARNASLRSGKPTPEAKKWRDRMAQATQSHRIENDSVVYRGAAFKPETVAKLTPGAVLSDLGVTSTDEDRDTAQFYGERRQMKNPGSTLTMFEIKVPAGMPGYDANYGEFVFGPDASMRILATRRTADGLEVTAEMLPPERG